MPRENNDLIHIRDLVVMCIVGTRPEERRRRRRVVVNIDLACDLSGVGDDLHKTVDYGAVCDRVRHVVGGSRYQLIETLAQCVADTCRGFPGVAGVVVTLDKPGAVRGCRSVAVTVAWEAP